MARQASLLPEHPGTFTWFLQRLGDLWQSCLYSEFLTPEMKPILKRIERDKPSFTDFAQPPESQDRMLGNMSRPHRSVFFPCGYEVQLETNSEAVLRGANNYLGAWTQRYHDRPLKIRFLVAPGDSSAAPPLPPFLHRVQGHLLTGIANRENFYCCDLLAGFAFGCVTLETAEDEEFLRVPIDNMVCALLWTSHVTAIHAACVMLGRRGVLLAGHSGAGKTSLAYACARRGWTFVSDDTSCLVKSGKGRTVIGNPYRFRFRETAGSLFPEFRGFDESSLPGGKPTIEVPTSALSGIETAVESSTDYIVFLNRRDGQQGRAEFSPVSRERKLRELFTGNWPSELPARQEDWATLQRLADVPAFELRYRELDVAVGALERLVRGHSC